VLSREIGYRRRIGSTLSLDLAAFYNTYDDLRTQEPTLPLGIPIVLANRMEARTSGVEIAADYEPAAMVRLHDGYTYLAERFRLKPDSLDPTNGTSEYNDPVHQVWGRSNIDVPHNLETDAVFRFGRRAAAPCGAALRGADAQVRVAPRPDRALAALRAIAGAPVLTVGDSEGFLEADGIVNLVVDAGKVRFDVNAEAAAVRGLRISSKLLRVARHTSVDARQDR
jgi:hypothetical protein